MAAEHQLRHTPPAQLAQRRKLALGCTDGPLRAAARRAGVAPGLDGRITITRGITNRQSSVVSRQSVNLGLQSPIFNDRVNSFLLVGIQLDEPVSAAKPIGCVP